MIENWIISNNVLSTQEIYDGKVKGQLNGCVDKLEWDWRLWVDEQRPDGVEERLQDHPDELAERRAEQFGLQQRRNVGVQNFVALILQKKNNFIKEQ